MKQLFKVALLTKTCKFIVYRSGFQLIMRGPCIICLFDITTMDKLLDCISSMQKPLVPTQNPQCPMEIDPSCIDNIFSFVELIQVSKKECISTYTCTCILL